MSPDIMPRLTSWFVIEISDWRAMGGDSPKAVLSRRTTLSRHLGGLPELPPALHARSKVLLWLDYKHLGGGPRCYSKPCETILIPDN